MPSNQLVYSTTTGQPTLNLDFKAECPSGHDLPVEVGSVVERLCQVQLEKIGVIMPVQISEIWHEWCESCFEADQNFSIGYIDGLTGQPQRRENQDYMNGWNKAKHDLP